MGCLCCGAEPDVGALCRSCALEIVPCDGLIPDHIHSRIDSTDAEAWVVDGFGGAHAVGAFAGIGRSHERELIVLASSVSREHAELSHTDTGWVVRDLGSRNGTFVNGDRRHGPTELRERARLKFGDVALWFLPEVMQEMSQQPTETTDGSKGRLVSYQLERGNLELSIVVGDDHAAAGLLRWRRVGAETWSERKLSALEFQLLRALCQRAHEEAGSPLSVRGCVPTKQLLAELPFLSKYANHENVRQVVLRLRGQLTDVGVQGLLAVAPGRGYYLACRVAMATIE